MSNLRSCSRCNEGIADNLKHEDNTSNRSKLSRVGYEVVKIALPKSSVAVQLMIGISELYSTQSARLTWIRDGDRRWIQTKRN